MAERMIGVRASIVRIVDGSCWPCIVEVHFADVHGITHRFIEKSAIVTADNVDERTSLPHPAVIACRIRGIRAAHDSAEIVMVDTKSPWYVESLDENTQFDVHPEHLVEWEFGSQQMLPWVPPIPGS
jgi:hypothetical protein